MSFCVSYAHHRQGRAGDMINEPKTTVTAAEAAAKADTVAEAVAEAIVA